MIGNVFAHRSIHRETCVAQVSLLAALGVCSLVRIEVAAQDSDGDTLSLYTIEQFTYDDNLYRLPRQFADLESIIGPGTAREDYINRASLGIAGRWAFARQAIALDLQVDDNRFRNNEVLDHTGGNGAFRWDWRAGGNLTGQVGADYKRALAGFANSRFLAKDLLDTQGYFGNVAYLVGTRWTVRAGVRDAETSHSAASRDLDNVHAQSGNVALEYETAVRDVVGWEYRYTEARYPRNATALLRLVDRDYRENSWAVRVKYAPSAKTLLEARGGYIERIYPAASTSDVGDGFSGETWRASVQWLASAKTQLKIQGWRELRAYVDAESEYFVSEGGSVTPLWQPTDKWHVSLECSLENQDYLGSGLAVNAGAGRRDTVSAGELVLSYQPRDWIHLHLSYRAEQRGSNRLFLEYEDRVTSVDLQLTL